MTALRKLASSVQVLQLVTCGIGRPNSFYAILVDPENSKIVGVEPPPPLEQEYPKGMTSDGYRRIYPVGLDETERVWRRSYKTIQACIESGEVICRKRTINISSERTNWKASSSV